MIPMPIFHAISVGKHGWKKARPDNTYMQPEAIEQELQMIQRAVKLDASTASEAYSYIHKTVIEPEDHPLCVPPWQVTWLEYRVPDKLWVNGKWIHQTPGAMGAFVVHADTNSVPDGKDKQRSIQQFMDGWCAGNCGIKELNEGERHLLMIHPWILGDGDAYPLDMRVVAILDEKGMFTRWTASMGAPCKDVEMTKDDVAGMFLSVLFAFSLANCKNIIAEEERGYFKVRSKGKAKEFYKYHVLKIDGKLVRWSDDSDAASKDDRSMHICRGHFARYSEDKPLFGRYVGLFWKPMHLRGKVANGVVDKDYQV